MMMMLPLAKVPFLWTLVIVLWVLIAVAMILIVLIQKGRGGGLGAAFGGGGANSLLGTKTGDFLTWVTISLVALFLVMAIIMGKFMRPEATSGLVDTAVQTQTDIPAGEMPGADAVAEQAEQAAGAAVEQAAEAVQEAAAEVPAVPAEQPAAPAQN